MPVSTGNRSLSGTATISTISTGEIRYGRNFFNAGEILSFSFFKRHSTGVPVLKVPDHHVYD
jgi:hypothetical protein